MNRFPDISKKQLKKIIEERLKDHFVKLQKIDPYYQHIFSSTPNCWFHDLMDNGRNIPRYWNIFIGTNNHYAVVLPLQDKRAPNIRETLRLFIDKYHPYKLTSDEVPAIID